MLDGNPQGFIFSRFSAVSADFGIQGFLKFQLLSPLFLSESAVL